MYDFICAVQSVTRQQPASWFSSFEKKFQKSGPKRVPEKSLQNRNRCLLFSGFLKISGIWNRRSSSCTGNVTPSCQQWQNSLMLVTLTNRQTHTHKQSKFKGSERKERIICLQCAIRYWFQCVIRYHRLIVVIYPLCQTKTLRWVIAFRSFLMDARMRPTSANLPMTFGWLFILHTFFALFWTHVSHWGFIRFTLFARSAFPSVRQEKSISFSFSFSFFFFFAKKWSFTDRYMRLRRVLLLIGSLKHRFLDDLLETD